VALEKSAFLIFPHQLYKDIDKLKSVNQVYLIEEHLYFNQYKFHKQKLIFHRSTMRFYHDNLFKNGISAIYINAQNDLCDVRKLIKDLSSKGINEICVYDVCDDWLERRIFHSCQKNKMKLIEYDSQIFINTKQDLKVYFENKKRYFQTDFYIQQRKKLNILIEDGQKPVGGKWSFDAENRVKYPKSKVPPRVEFPHKNEFIEEAINYVESNFKENYGNISSVIIYPSTHLESEKWLEQFLDTRLKDFGEFEDAIVQKELILHHSLLSPLLNVGLLTPKYVVNQILDYAKNHEVPLNSLEGLIRQIIGWREFIRGVYVYKGRQERTINFWKFTKKLSSKYYNGSTGIEPLDSTIQKVVDTAYCHHIERLMILGNYMVLQEIDPNEVYKWFMEMFIDAYDWVMVTNVYGMSQFADGGLMATKPYISGSSYILKMSDHPKGSWSEKWDALFWVFMNKHRDFFLSNPRLGMLIKTYDKMSEEKKNGYELVVSMMA
jgi:deoxyribodipyrimidine photolyase-related protein